MAAPLSKRLGFADRWAEVRCDRGLMARALMYSFGAGALVAFGSVAAAPAPASVSAGVCLATAAVLLIGYDDLPRWSFAVFTAVGAGLGVLAVGEGGSGYATLLALPIGYSAYFLRKREAAAAVAILLGGRLAVGWSLPAA